MAASRDLRRIGARARDADGLCAAARQYRAEFQFRPRPCGPSPKSAEPIALAAEVGNILRRAFAGCATAAAAR